MKLDGMRVATSTIMPIVLLGTCACTHNPAAAPVVPRTPLPPPPSFPNMAAADCTPGPFIVFFGWDSVAITAEAAAILDNAVVRYIDCGRVRVTLSGFADRSGPASYNLALSRRRAEAIGSYFARRSVDPALIVIKPFGEDLAHLRTQTADGVREVRNRRVEITYSSSD